jgi:hypothetical protein
MQALFLFFGLTSWSKLDILYLVSRDYAGRLMGTLWFA